MQEIYTVAEMVINGSKTTVYLFEKLTPEHFDERFLFLRPETYRPQRALFFLDKTSERCRSK